MTTRPRHELRRRHLRLEGAENFRDVGGYPTHDGRRVRWGTVYRSDSLATLSVRDLETVDALGLRLVCDFRGEAEIAEEPNRLADRPPIHYWHRPIGNSAVQPSEWRRRFEAGDLGDVDAGWLTRSYRGMIDESATELAAVFRRLAAPEGVPAVLHCTAGKDRTGVAVALLLLLLGVSRECVIEDYALTGVLTGDRIRAAERLFRDRGIDPAKVTALMGSVPDTLAGALEHLEARHGGAERWARAHAGLAAEELEALRDALLV